MVQQTLYVDFAGGKFEAWYYSEGSTFRKSSWEFSDLKKWAIKNSFTKFIFTDEAKNRI